MGQIPTNRPGAMSPRAFALSIVLIGAFSVAVVAEDGPEPPPGSTASRMVGQRAPNFTLRDVTTDGQLSLYGYRGSKAVVLVFTGVECPVGNAYLPRLDELNRAYASRKVRFLAINSNASESAERVAAHAKEFGVGFPVLKDPGNIVADSLLAERTCEVLLMDGSAKLVYRGAIDDQYTQTSRKPKPSEEFLVAAIEDVLAGRKVRVSSTEVAGCPIERVAPRVASTRTLVRPASAEILQGLKETGEDAEVEVGKVTYAGEVATIIQDRCQSCHRPGQVGPFTLNNYDDARRWAASIREVVDDRRMPPWHADPRYGHFSNDRRLSARERSTLIAWVDQGAPLGDAAKVPAPRTYPEGWTIGTPDLVFQIPEDYQVAAQGALPYVRFRVPTNFKEDVWVQAAEAVPGARSVVHHIIVYVDDPKGQKLHFCGYAPGDMPSRFPEGIAKKIPAGSDLVFEIHYTPNGKRQVDRSKVGFVLAKGTVRHEARIIGIAQDKFLIPPDAANHPVTSTHTLDKPVRLLSFMPHMHLRGKSFKYSLTTGGETKTLLSVPAYDFAWQSYYTLSEPMDLPAGSRIDCEAHYDNSAGNPANPDRKRAVHWGDQTFDEMMIGYVDYVDAEPIEIEIGPGGHPIVAPKVSATAIEGVR
ncbi:redoxin domain-containing protein [Isosphaeraceae bacterium EP7]